MTLLKHWDNITVAFSIVYARVVRRPDGRDANMTMR
jgi:hypothetical protein